MKNNKIIFFIIFLFLNSKAFTNESIEFLSLKNNQVNLRQGPSFEYPVKLVYKKKFLPVLILDESETWRLIQDFEKNTGWIHISQLSKRKSAINIKNNSIMYKKPTIYSTPFVKLESGRLVLVEKCKQKWCKIKSGDYVGWTYKKYLWGRI